MMEPKTVQLTDVEAGLRRKWLPKAEKVAEPKAQEPTEVKADAPEVKEPDKPKTEVVDDQVKSESKSKESVVSEEPKPEVRQAVKQADPTYADRTEAAVNDALEVLPEDLRPSEDLLIAAIKNLKDLDKMSDSGRASAIIREAIKVKASQAANEPKDELKKKVQLPGNSNKAVVADSIKTRLNSSDDTVRSKACKEGIMSHFYSKGLVDRPNH